jgi:hypothetical protein
MSYQKKYPNFTNFIKAWLICVVLATMMCMGIFAHADPMTISVVGAEIEICGACQNVDVYIEVEDVPTPSAGTSIPPPPDQAVMAMHFILNYDPDCLEVVDVECIDRTASLTVNGVDVEEWAMEWNDVDSEGNPIGELSVALAQDPSDGIPQECWEDEDCDEFYPPNSDPPENGIYWLPGDGNILKVTFHVIGCLEEPEDYTDLLLDSVLINEGEIDPVVVDGEIRCKEPPVGPKKCFTMTIQPGINLVSIPLDPQEEWTIQNLFEQTQAKYMFWWNSDALPRPKFEFYVPGKPTTPVGGGVGYVVIRGDDDPAVDVTYEGVAWSNTSAPEDSEIRVATNTLTVSGIVYDEDEQPAEGYTVVVANEDNSNLAPETDTTEADGSYVVGFFGIGDIVKEGDTIKVVATNPATGETAEATETYKDEYVSEMTIDVYFTATRYFEVTFNPDINLIGVPLDPAPDTGWTIEDLFNSIPVRYMFWWNRNALPRPKFEFYIPGKPTIPIEGGVGYVAICGDDPAEHIYEGVAWETQCPTPAAPVMISESVDVPYTSVFAVAGQIQQPSHGELDGLSIRLHNSRTKQTLSTKPAEDGSYDFVFFDLWNRDVMAAGDSLTVTIEDTSRTYQSETFEIVLDVKDIRNHLVTLEPIQLCTVPKETKLLANYPNPFNPETWIPYQLSQDAGVTIRIYGLSGQLVRSLDLGHRSAGHYITSSKAAYWDGTNQLGEHVASGVYFYTLQADRFTATRKLLIVK